MKSLGRYTPEKMEGAALPTRNGFRYAWIYNVDFVYSFLLLLL